MLRPWNILSTELIHQTRVLDLVSQRSQSVEFPERIGDYVVLDVPNWVNVIAITPDEQMVLIRQFRQGTGKMTLEIPGGMVDPGEDFVTAGVRELLEETGGVGVNPIQIGVAEPNPALQNNLCGTILVRDVVLGEPNLDPNEEIEVVLVPVTEVPELIRTGEIAHSLVITAFHWYHLHVTT